MVDKEVRRTLGFCDPFISFNFWRLHSKCYRSRRATSLDNVALDMSQTGVM